ncbi:MAG TPA: dihydroorotase family protein [Methylomirabilota bacterium]|nr:dihydroorotase family protein [Methylomirabilota bacterium]
MPDRAPLDLVVKNVRVVRPRQDAVETRDLGIVDGRFARAEPSIPVAEAREVYDARGHLGFPGVVDAHTHVGIYGPLADDAVTESQAAVSGGVTTVLTYFRTGQYYLNRGGSYADFYPEVLARSRDRYWCDYGYHLAPIQASHIDEMEDLATRQGVPSFKIFMFYGGHGLHGQADRAAQRRFLMVGEDESYDLAHFEFIMRAASRIRRAYPRLAPHVTVSLHCEIADILNAYTQRAAREGTLAGLRAYNAARPPHAEGLAVWIAGYLAHETDCPGINLLHLSSRKAVEAALALPRVFPHLDVRREVTVGHLLLDCDAPTGVLAKVNPPIRPREDVEFLWQALLARQLDWVVSDHACCAREMKVAAERPDDIWLARSGFGGTEYLLSGVVSEGRRRGMAYSHIAEVLAWNPAQRFGLPRKGDIAPGYDADLALVDPTRRFTVRGADSPSGQGYTPFEGQELTGRVVATFLRGGLVYDGSRVIGPPRGRYLARPDVA